MTVSRNALSNLINRYRSVLQKCCAKNALNLRLRSCAVAVGLFLAASLCLPSAAAAANSGGSVVKDIYTPYYFYIGDLSSSDDVIIESEADQYPLGTPITLWSVYGGKRDSLDVQGRTLIFGDASHAPIVKYAYGAYTGNGHAENNTLIINNGTVEWGAFAGHTEKGNANDNTLLINGGMVTGKVYSGDTMDGDAHSNHVFINGGTLEDVIYAGSTGQGDATDNTVTISGGIMEMSVYAGHTEKGTAKGNTLTIISGGTVKRDVFCGWTEDGDATGNTVNISGGAVERHVYGGATIKGDATGNIVSISGGTVTGNVYGGHARDSGNATGNTVIISGAPVLSGSLYGGARYLPGSANLVSGNTLEVRNIGLKAKNVYNFENYHFYLPATVKAGDIALTLTDMGPTDLTKSTTNAAIIPKVGVGIAGGAAPLKPGDKIYLLRNENGLNSTGYQEVSLKGKHGVSLEYDFTLDADSNNLFATVPAVPAPPGPGPNPDPGPSPVRVNPQIKSVSEANLAGMALALQGADLVARQTGVYLPKETKDLGLYIFGIVSGGDIRYNTSSHVDMRSFSLISGPTLGKSFTLGHIILGGFFEYGNGSYDTYNSFAHAASVHGEGHNWYMGGGLLAHMDFVPTGPGHIYLEASGRAGSLHNDYNGSDDLRDPVTGKKAAFENSTPYYSLHTGTGYVWQPMPNLALDLFAKYFWTHLGSDTVTLATDEKVHFDSINSHRLRLGARADYALSEYIAPYIGAAWEYEFDGKARAQVYGLPIDAPKLKGSTGIGEIGLTLTPSANLTLSIDLVAQGYVGRREGVTGSLFISYEF